VETLETAIVGGFFPKTESRKLKSSSQTPHFHAVRRQINCHSVEQNPTANSRRPYLFTGDPQVFPQISCAYAFKTETQKAKRKLISLLFASLRFT
jgi:hypothetical protein